MLLRIDRTSPRSRGRYGFQWQSARAASRREGNGYDYRRRAASSPEKIKGRRGSVRARLAINRTGRRFERRVSFQPLRCLLVSVPPIGDLYAREIYCRAPSIRTHPQPAPRTSEIRKERPRARGGGRNTREKSSASVSGYARARSSARSLPTFAFSSFRSSARGFPAERGRARRTGERVVERVSADAAGSNAIDWT